METKNSSPADSKSQTPQSFEDQEDVKPILPAYHPLPANAAELPNDTKQNPDAAKRWSPGKWQDANRKSAFQPYKQVCTVLTNLQRGNTQAETPIPQETEVSFHTRAGQGEITAEDIKNEPYVDVRDGNGLTPLHWASAYGQLVSVQLLLEARAKIDLEGPDGETPLLLAASGGHHEVVRLLLGEGADPNRVDHVIFPFRNAIRFADACVFSQVGNSALMYAAYGNHPHCCNELLLRGADVTITNMNDDTAFSLACENNSNLGNKS